MRRGVCEVFLALLLVGVLSSPFQARSVKAWAGTVYIRGDGSIDPSDAPILRKFGVYWLTGNITTDADGIIIEKDDVVVDGAGYTIHCSYSGPPRRGNGVLVTGRRNITIRKMNVDGAINNINLQNSSHITVTESNFTNGDYGIRLTNSSHNSISKNNITAGPIYYAGTGIWLADSSNNSIFGNNVFSNSVGFVFMLSANNSIFENNIRTNVDGAGFDGSSDNVFYHNNFANNNRQIVITSILGSSANVWDHDHPSGGNYWSNHNPPDKDKDKIGDMPYTIDEDNTDRHPLIYPYGYEPKPDANGDGIVNLKDLYLVARAYETEPGDNLWNPIADINAQIAAELDEIINLKDIYQIAKNYRKE